jgi:hypothetical protein
VPRVACPSHRNRIFLWPCKFFIAIVIETFHSPALGCRDSGTFRAKGVRAAIVGQPPRRGTGTGPQKRRVSGYHCRAQAVGGGCRACAGPRLACLVPVHAMVAVAVPTRVCRWCCGAGRRSRPAWLRYPVAGAAPQARVRGRPGSPARRGFPMAGLPPPVLLWIPPWAAQVRSPPPSRKRTRRGAAASGYLCHRFVFLARTATTDGLPAAPPQATADLSPRPAPAADLSQIFMLFRRKPVPPNGWPRAQPPTAPTPQTGLSRQSRRAGLPSRRNGSHGPEDGGGVTHSHTGESPLTISNRTGCQGVRGRGGCRPETLPARPGRVGARQRRHPDTPRHRHSPRR